MIYGKRINLDVKTRKIPIKSPSWSSQGVEMFLMTRKNVCQQEAWRLVYSLFSHLKKSFFSRLLLRCAEGSLLNDSGVQFFFFCNCLSLVFDVTAMIALVFINCRLAELLQNSNRNPGRLSKVATTSGPRCGDVSGPIMALRFCSPYWWWKRHWLMQIVFVLWLLKRYVVYRGAKTFDKSLENYCCLSAASY